MQFVRIRSTNLAKTAPNNWRDVERPQDANCNAFATAIFSSLEWAEGSLL